MALDGCIGEPQMISYRNRIFSPCLSPPLPPSFPDAQRLTQRDISTAPYGTLIHPESLTDYLMTPGASAFPALHSAPRCLCGPEERGPLLENRSRNKAHKEKKPSPLSRVSRPVDAVLPPDPSGVMTGWFLPVIPHLNSLCSSGPNLFRINFSISWKRKAVKITLGLSWSFQKGGAIPSVLLGQLIQKPEFHAIMR